MNGSCMKVCVELVSGERRTSFNWGLGNDHYCWHHYNILTPTWKKQDYVPGMIGDYLDRLITLTFVVLFCWKYTTHQNPPFIFGCLGIHTWNDGDILAWKVTKGLSFPSTEGRCQRWRPKGRPALNDQAAQTDFNGWNINLIIISTF